MKSKPAKGQMLGIALLLAIAACNFFLFLGRPPIKDWDEARHGVTAYEMLHTGSYLINTYQFMPDYWNTKPPLSFWTTAAGFKVFGLTPFGLRAASAACSLATVALIVLFSGRRFSWSVGLLAGGIAITMPDFVLLHNARTGDPDALFILLSTAALLATLHTRRNPALIYWAGLFLALAFLTKGFHAAVPVFLSLVLLVWIGRERKFTRRQLCGYAAAGLLPVCLWAAARYSHDGLAFLQPMFFYDVLERATTNLEGHGHPAYYYAAHLAHDLRYLRGFALLCLLALLAYRRRRKRWPESFENADGTLIAQIVMCAALPVVIFSCASSKIYWYIFPAVPFLSIVLAIVIQQGMSGLQEMLSELRVKKALLVGLIAFFCILEVRLMRQIVKQAKAKEPIQYAILSAGQEGMRGAPLYLEESEWRQSAVLAAKLYGDFVPKDGGRSAWQLSVDKSAVLLNKDLQMERFDAP